MKKIVIGADISKNHIDFTLYSEGTAMMHRQVDNNKKKLNEFLLELLDMISIEWDHFEIIVALEHTGIYGELLLQVVTNLNIKASVIHSALIKKVSNFDRIKNDKVDSKLIAEYAWRFWDKLNIYKPLAAVLKDIKTLMSERSKLVKTRTILTQGRSDQKIFLNKKTTQFLEHNINSTIKHLNKAIADIEEKVYELILQDEELENNYNIAISVPGIGKVTAAALLSYTNNFTKFSNAKQLGCYCGVVPFERSSGIFKGKGRTSKKANMELKVLLTMGAWSVSTTNNHFGQYYRRKLAESKKESLAINNVRNKILKTVFACVKNQTKYRYDYVHNIAA